MLELCDRQCMSGGEEKEEKRLIGDGGGVRGIEQRVRGEKEAHGSDNHRGPYLIVPPSKIESSSSMSHTIMFF